MSTYPESCTVSIERRTLPGETADLAVSEITAACERLRAADPSFSARVKLTTAQLPSDVAITAPIVERLRSALQHENVPVKIEGLSAWTDAALLNEAGIPAICFGPGDIALAHAAEEFVPVTEILTATKVLGAAVSNWMQ